jgi:hypothetical protein
MASAAARSIAGSTWAYTSRVIATRLCPRRSLTTLIGTPACNSKVACVCLRSWSQPHEGQLEARPLRSPTVRDHLGPPWTAVGPGEHQRIGHRRPARLSRQDRRRVVVEVQRPDLAGLGALQPELPPRRGEGGSDPELWDVEVEVLPPQAEQFAAAHTGAERDPPQVVELAVAGVPQEVGDLVGVPGPQPPRLVIEPGVDAGNLGTLGGVRVEESVGDRVVERLAQDRVGVGDGPSGQGPTASTAVLEETHVVEAELP